MRSYIRVSKKTAVEQVEHLVVEFVVEQQLVVVQVEQQFVVQVERDVVEFVLVLRKLYGVLYGVLMWLMPRNMGFLVVVQVEHLFALQVRCRLATCTSSVQVEQQVVVVQVEQQLVGKLYQVQRQQL